jgi:hypothetical protein
MPHTTYGLFTAIRSHRIDLPSAARSLLSGRPNACNLCHLDRSQAWTADHLSRWYGAPPVAVEGDDRTVAASLVWLLRGDAAQRAVAAWHMGWEPARRASGDAWIAPFLAQLLDDPYSAVRFVAYRALRALPGFGDLQYDFVGAPDERRQAVREERGPSS